MTTSIVYTTRFIGIDQPEKQIKTGITCQNVTLIILGVARYYKQGITESKT